MYVCADALESQMCFEQRRRRAKTTPPSDRRTDHLQASLHLHESGFAPEFFAGAIIHFYITLINRQPWLLHFPNRIPRPSCLALSNRRQWRSFEGQFADVERACAAHCRQAKRPFHELGPVSQMDKPTYVQ
jgi:hypothetical protein